MMNSSLFSEFYQPSELTNAEMTMLAYKYIAWEILKGTIVLKRGEISNEKFYIRKRHYTYLHF